MTYPEAVELIDYWARAARGDGDGDGGGGGGRSSSEPVIHDMSKDDMRALARSLGA